ncbi:ParB/RepB/Spo0J family partition protein [Leptospira congkakensis]|uniref:ParB/RepB/Spo0J family partition protein n=1 Tax=Leptospira congkakensis TaxID=2484932 RepID=A0A4Z1AEB7_9LEPT|nr:ParB/RepB/Spo0J family partition protein [Leptospira congkakensis]TGL88319.1 ParB/RepB/Spo0J family partition protein [Leptospira congkakensis]TGL95425.1 ParB/RepB/Spo0J family partition protein [Leptospira congkakensis]TGL96506.1 ParB/RepB/Spo0J family partition protein [Leptospira congkakensis]
MSLKSKRLGTLADIYQAENLDGTIRTIRMDKIQPSEHQPRQERKKGIEELAQTLKADGLLQPIIVSKGEREGSYKIIAGERRYHAAKSLGWSEIECKILNRPDKEIYKLAVIENLQRENLSPYEEVDALLFLKNSHNYTDQELGDLFGKSRSYMTEVLSITSMSKEDLDKCKKNEIYNKNLLVQAAQAAKKGSLDEFLTLFHKGALKTVRDAKDFNKQTKSGESNSSKNQTLSGYKIRRTGTGIQILSDDEILLGDIYKFIRKELVKKYGDSA